MHGPEFATSVGSAAELIGAPTRPLLLEAGEPYERAIAAARPATEWTPRRPDR